jgi:hypothetical protein
MMRRYSPNHPAVMSWQGATPADLNRPYRAPLVGLGCAILGGAVIPWMLPVIGLWGQPMPILWAVPFVAVAIGCYVKCERLLEKERQTDK